MKKARSTCQLALRFFGLTPENKDVILEQIFVLMQHINFSYLDAYKLPVWKRVWFINRLKYQFEEEKKSIAQEKKNSSQVFKKSF